MDLNIIDKCLDASLKPEPVSAAPVRLHNFNRKYTLVSRLCRNSKTWKCAMNFRVFKLRYSCDNIDNNITNNNCHHIIQKNRGGSPPPGLKIENNNTKKIDNKVLSKKHKHTDKQEI